MTTQVVAKQTPQDRVGNVVTVDGQVGVIEYSELPDEVAEKRNADGSLYLWAGSIAVHVFDVGFLERMVGNSAALPFHRAHKKVSHVDDQGNMVKPEAANAIKFERFIFDLMPHARSAMAVEVDAAEAFAPVKNASGAGTETPETARAAMVDQHVHWLREAGVQVEAGVPVEISPLFALDADELAGKVERGTVIREPTWLR
jgi:UDP-N-acetylglucosamine/UDP-N-acetylgalactosamine diphosphorylase